MSSSLTDKQADVLAATPRFSSFQLKTNILDQNKYVKSDGFHPLLDPFLPVVVNKASNYISELLRRAGN